MTDSLFAHQVEGVRVLAGAAYHWVGDEMGLGKTRQVIAAAETLYRAGEVCKVVVVAPAAVVAAWADPEFGQLVRFSAVPVRVTEYRGGRARSWGWSNPDDSRTPLEWVVANYELVRRAERRKEFLAHCGPATVLVLDESIAVKSARAQQTRACWNLRLRCGRVWLLNGTEGGGDNPGDLYSQAKMMSPDVLGCSTRTEFLARYAKVVRRKIGDRKAFDEVVEWINLDDLWRRLAPYYLRRTKVECLDLHPKLPPVVIEARLSPETWRLYVEMKRDAVAWLESGRCSAAAQAIVRVLRLAQLCGGFLGGVEGEEGGPPREVSREKLDALLSWLDLQGPGAKAVIWSRFRAEALRAAEELRRRPEYAREAGTPSVELLVGGQDRVDREAALRLMDPRTAPQGAAAVVGTIRTGAFGVDLQAADRVVYLSNDWSHVARTQSEDRVHRPGQTRPVSYFDIVASGPAGQRTVDHTILRALHAKRDLAAYGPRELAAELRRE
jgi:hypothetical protein